MRAALRPRTRRPLRDQVLVITGASSGIGLATAQYGAIAGARVVMVSRNKAILRERSEELNRDGATTIAIGADVTSAEQMQEVAEQAIATFGRIDSWINNAGVALLGLLDGVPVQDARRVFDVNYFGVVNGTLAALPHLRKSGGTLINVGGGIAGERAPQGHYAASKAAMRAFTCAIRDELEAEAAGVSVVMVEPSTMDTPFRLHARSYLGFTPPLTTPVYVPEVAAGVILRCAVEPRHEIKVGAGAMAQWRMMSRQPLPGANESARATSAVASARKPGNLIEWSLPAGKLRGGYSGHVRVNSALTSLSLRLSPAIASLATAAMTTVSFTLMMLLAH